MLCTAYDLLEFQQQYPAALPGEELVDFSAPRTRSPYKPVRSRAIDFETARLQTARPSSSWSWTNLNWNWNSATLKSDPPASTSRSVRSANSRRRAAPSCVTWISMAHLLTRRQTLRCPLPSSPPRPLPPRPPRSRGRCVVCRNSR